MTFPKPTECRGQEQSQDSLSIAPEPYKFSQLFLAWEGSGLSKAALLPGPRPKGAEEGRASGGGSRIGVAGRQLLEIDCSCSLVYTMRRSQLCPGGDL
jgi:hypothetical protein